MSVLLHGKFLSIYFTIRLGDPACFAGSPLLIKHPSINGEGNRAAPVVGLSTFFHRYDMFVYGGRKARHDWGRSWGQGAATTEAPSSSSSTPTPVHGSLLVKPTPLFPTS